MFIFTLLYFVASFYYGERIRAEAVNNCLLFDCLLTFSIIFGYSIFGG